jgi:hypothetical protein
MCPSQRVAPKKRTCKVEYIYEKMEWYAVVEASRMDHGSEAWDVVKSSWWAMTAS